jgi:hypothetical protein
METSKKLLWIFVAVFIVSVVVVGIADVVLSAKLSYLLNYVIPTSTSVILGYIGKSGFENVTKIKTSPTDGFSVDTNGNSIAVQPGAILDSAINQIDNITQ